MAFDPIANGATKFDPTANGATPVKQSSGIGRNIGGIVGGTVGQVVGTPFDLVSGPVGTIAGGAIGGGAGGAIGETIDQLLSGHGLNFGNIGKATGEQAAYGAIPVGNELRALPLIGKVAGNVAGRTALRAGAGTAGSAAAQGIQNGNVDVGQALESGGLNALLPGLGEGVNMIGKGLTQGVPDKISKALANKYVGLKSANKPGITSLIHPDIEQTIQNLEDEMDKSYGAVNTFLTDKTAPYGEFVNSLSEVAKKQIPSLKPEKDLGTYTNQLQDWLSNLINERVSNIPGNTMPKGVLDPNTQLPLSVFNDVKHMIGKSYNSDGASLVNQLYGTAKNFVEKYSGDAEHVSSLNKNYNDLREARNMAKQYYERLRTNPNLGSGLDLKGDIPVALAGLLLHGLPGAGVGVAGHELYRHVIKNPETAKQVSDVLTNLGKNKAISAGTNSIGRLLDQLGIRIPGAASK